MSKEQPRVEKFVINYPKSREERTKWNSEYGLNAIYAGKHWSLRQRDAEYWHLLVLSAINKAKVSSELFQSPVEVSFFWNDNLDIDNHAYMGKMIVDALRGRLIVNDNRRFVRAVHHEFHDTDCIGVTVCEV